MRLDNMVKVLTKEDMAVIHENALHLLENKGVLFESDKTVETFKKAGARTDGNVVYIPKKMVEDALKNVPKYFDLAAMDPDKGVRVGEGFLCHPAGGEVFMIDHKGVRNNTPTLKDFADLQKIYHACENVDMAGYQPISPSDVPERTKGLHMALTSLQCSDKPMVCPMELDTNEQRTEVLDLLEIAYGKNLNGKYMTWQIVCPNSPLFYTKFACEGIDLYATRNQPICIVGAPLSGITGPVQNFANVTLAIADELAGLTYAQLIQPGIPVLLSGTLTYGNMRYATWECSSPDTILMMAAVVQHLKDFYGLPARCQAGIASSKIIDWQAGMEGMQGLLFAALAGANVVSQPAGSLANLLTTSKEKIVLDNEAIARVRAIVAGIKTGEEYRGMDDIMEVKHGGDFMMRKSTLKYMREGFQPSICDWRDPDVWEKAGAEDIRDVAHAKVEEILKEAPESILDPALEKELKQFIKKIEDKVL